MADTVKRIEPHAFAWCRKLAFVRLPRNLEYIGNEAFDDCWSLTSIFIPDSCRQIGRRVFHRTAKLIIFIVPLHTELGKDVFYLPDCSESVKGKGQLLELTNGSNLSTIMTNMHFIDYVLQWIHRRMKSFK